MGSVIDLVFECSEDVDARLIDACRSVSKQDVISHSRNGRYLLVRVNDDHGETILNSFRSSQIPPISAVACTLVEAWKNGVCIYDRPPEICFAKPPLIDVSAEDIGQIAQRVEVLLVTATPIELQAVASILEPLPGRDGIVRGPVWKTTLRIGIVGRYQTAHIQCTMGGTGRDGAILAAQRAIEIIRPKAVVVIGIAFGISPKKQRLGDVLVAESIAPYELGKIREEGVTHRGQILPCGTLLSSRFRDLSDDWNYPRRRGSVSVSQGLILSGEKVVDSVEFRDRLLVMYPSAIGGEMEGAGVYAACDGSKTEVILVKGICDWADGSKSDEAQPFAAATSTSLVKHVLSKPDVLLDLGAFGVDLPTQRKDISVASAPVPVDRSSAVSRFFRRLFGQPSAPQAPQDPIDTSCQGCFLIRLEGEVSAEAYRMIQEAINKDCKNIIFNIRSMRRGSVVFEVDGTELGYQRLKLAIAKPSFMSILNGRRVVLDAFEPRAWISYRQNNEYRSMRADSTICHLDYIGFFEREHDEAIGILETETDRLELCNVYLTIGVWGQIYAHSNYVKRGASRAVKLRTGETNDLLVILAYLIVSGNEERIDEAKLRRLHENDVVYLMSPKMFDESGQPILSLQNAKHVVRVET